MLFVRKSGKKRDELKELNLGHKAYEIEHPYNLSFINSKEAQELFSKMDLLSKQKKS